MVQIREAAVPARVLADAVRRACDAVAGTATRVVVNERCDVALAAGAHGVHLRADSFAASRVRSIVPADFLVGRSVHTLDEALAAEREGADYLLFGTVFPSPSKAGGHRVAGLEALREACSGVRCPVIAIGGITDAGADAVVRSGAAGVAAISYFGVATSLSLRVKSLRQAFDT